MGQTQEGISNVQEFFARMLRAIPFTIALFDGEGAGAGAGGEGGAGAGGEGAGAGGEGGGAGAGAGGGAGEGGGRGRARSGDGRFQSGDGDRGRVYATDLDEANRRIGELNDENGTRRRENKDLKKELSSVTARQALVDQRAIRMEAREALRDRGVIDPDVVDLLLKSAGDKIKIDEKTGDIVGVGEAADEFKKAKPQFFKAAPSGNGAGDKDPIAEKVGEALKTRNVLDAAATSAAFIKELGDKLKADDKGEIPDLAALVETFAKAKPELFKPADARGNATGSGASPAGGGSGGGDGAQAPDFRDKNVSLADGLKQYAQSQR